MSGWNPDAVAPPMRGGVYERERRVGSLMGHTGAVLAGLGLALLLVAAQTIVSTGTIFGMPIG